jgi:putative endonuclease
VSDSEGINPQGRLHDGGSDPELSWWVYIAKCADGTLYVGSTTNVERRLVEHNAGTGAKYTRTRRPVELSYIEPASGMGGALKREYEIKRMKRAEKLRLCVSQKEVPRRSLR